MYIYFNNSLAFEKNIWMQPHFTGYIYSLYQNGNKLRKVMILKHLSLGNCQEAFSKRACVLFWICQEPSGPEYSGIKRRGTPFPGLRNPGISHYGDKYPLPFYEPCGKR